MNTEEQIKNYIASHPEPKRAELQRLHELVLKTEPKCRQWFSDGKNEEGKVVANPSIGYGLQTIRYADGKSKEFFRIGLSANATGFSVYVLGLNDKKLLSDTIGKSIGKAKVTGYCIRFKKIEDIDLDVLVGAMRLGFEAHPPPNDAIPQSALSD